MLGNTDSHSSVRTTRQQGEATLRFSGEEHISYFSHQTILMKMAAFFFLLQNIAFLEIVCSIKTDARGYCIFKAVPMNTFTKWKRLV